MSKSNQYLNRCLDVFNAEKEVSENTKIVMFVEYAKLVVEEQKPSEWKTYPQDKPSKAGKYEVYRKNCVKQHYEDWNGTQWAYNENNITHFREIKRPQGL